VLRAKHRLLAAVMVLAHHGAGGAGNSAWRSLGSLDHGLGQGGGFAVVAVVVMMAAGWSRRCCNEGSYRNTCG